MASQKVFGSYQEIIDLHTEANHVSAIGIHTPTGDTPRKMFKGYFDQYKKYKYLGASITLVPAARLPADPMGVSYNSTGQVEGTAMDPRDALNPIMFHGCHGDDMGAILNTLYGNNSSISDSVDGLDGGAVSITDFVGASLWINMERLYYKALTDKTWKKANPMSGFKKGNLRPLVYSLATNRQIMPYDGSPAGIGAFTQGGDPTTQIVEDEDSELWSPARANNLQFFTPRLTRLGWMETRNVHATQRSGIEGIESADDIPEFIAQALDTTTTPAEMPKIYMGIILMAPAYGVEQYYRMIVNHRFAFKEFRGISFMPATDGVPSYVNANPDLFNGDTYEDWNSAEGGEVDPPEPGPTPDPPEPEPEYNGAYVSTLRVYETEPLYQQLLDSNAEGTATTVLATISTSPVATTVGAANGGIWCDNNMVPHPTVRLVYEEDGEVAWFVWKNQSNNLGWYKGISVASAMASTSRYSSDWSDNIIGFDRLTTYSSGTGVKSRVQQICNGTETVQVLS